MKSRSKLNLAASPVSNFVQTGHKTQIIKGEGSREYPIPDTEELVKRALKRGRGRKGKISKTGKTETSPVAKLVQGITDSPTIDLSQLLGRIFTVKAPTPTGSRELAAIVAGADHIQSLIADRQFEALFEARFGGIETIVRRAKGYMEPKYLPSLESLDDHCGKLRKSYGDALPKLIEEIGKRNPDAPLMAVIQKAIELLDEELMQILMVLKAYANAFDQYQDSRYARQLRAINFYMEQAFFLFQTGDLESIGSGEAVKPQLEMSAFQVGDVLLAGFGPMPLGTIPGSKGPVGVHLLMVPYDMLDWAPAVGLPLLDHESRHQVLHDVKGLEDQVKALPGKALRAESAARRLVLTADFYQLGRGKVKALDLLIKLMEDSIGEIDADINGGVCKDGEAYLYAMLLSFPAMLIREGRVKDAKSLLRTSSVYVLGELPNGDKALAFEPHPPDWIRAYITAAALDEIGATAAASKLRKLADEMVGKVPTHITWEDGEEKSATVIAIPAADIKAAAPIVARAIIREALPALGGKSNGDLVMWNAKRQAKVELLVELLLAGKHDVPTDKGHFFASYVGAAGALAYWRMLTSDQDPGEAMTQLNENVLLMLEQLMERFAKKAA